MGLNCGINPENPHYLMLAEHKLSNPPNTPSAINDHMKSVKGRRRERYGGTMKRHSPKRRDKDG